jgi:hypothetical protein
MGDRLLGEQKIRSLRTKECYPSPENGFPLTENLVCILFAELVTRDITQEIGIELDDPVVFEECNRK